MVALGLVAMTAAAGVASAGERRPLVSAHRGGAKLWPENSLTAFRGALGLAADLVEMDVHLTRDGEVVVIHDSTLDRTTTGRGPVAAHTLDELGAVSLRSAPGEGVPRLREVLALIGPTRTGLLVEIKTGVGAARYPGIEAKVLDLLAGAGLTARASVMAFEWDTLERLRALSPTVRLTGLLGAHAVDPGGLAAVFRRLAAIRVDDLGIERTLLSPEAVRAAHAAGLTIGAWTVNDADELRRVLASGVDYVTTDRPDLALELRAGP